MRRFVFAVFFAALLFLMAACSKGGAGGEPQPTSAPTSSTSRNVQTQSTVKVSETVANAETVDGSSPSQTAEPASTAAPVDTPATGDFPVVYLAGVLGLILLCSAGLLMLRRI